VSLDSPDAKSETGIRLQKVLAAAGVGSRRKCEELIEEGRVSVNGREVVEQGMRVDPTTDVIHVDGVRLAAAAGHVVLLLNKPRGVVTTMSDEHGRRCVGDLVGDRPERLFHVGRLDADTEGLLLLTNDGELAQRLAHPSHVVMKTYLARVAGPVPREVLATLRAGVDLDDGPVAVDKVRVIDSSGGKALIEIVLHEGRNRIVRRLLESVGHPVIDLVRTRMGPISLGDQRTGVLRELSAREVGELYTAVGM
jgi:23S rRNA pseudouridine2605 synthase